MIKNNGRICQASPENERSTMSWDDTQHSCDHHITLPKEHIRADRLAARLPKQAWQRLSAGEGAKGERLYDWAIIDLGTVETGYQALLVRRNRNKHNDLAYYRCHTPGPVGLPDLVRIAGTRWRVEENIQAGKDCAGLDEHQVRSWTSWHRWATLAILAHALLAVTAARRHRETDQPDQPDQHRHPTTEPDPEAEMIPLTCNEIRRLRAAITRPHRADLHIAWWSRFRRRHQHRAKLCHYRARHG